MAKQPWEPDKYHYSAEYGGEQYAQPTPQQTAPQQTAPIGQGDNANVTPVSGNVTADDATKSRVNTRLERHLAKQNQTQTTPLTDSGNYQAALGALSSANGIDGSGDTLQSVYDQIVNRKPFSYNIDEDMMYRQYVDQYTNLGRLAMNDTMGQAAMLTGGYGSSYGQAVGQQQYDAYLQQLNGIIPDLYDRAYQRYMDEGTALQNKYAFMQANPQYAGGSTGGSSGGSLPTTVQNPGLTRDEIIEFQKANGLTPDGEWGPYTQKMWNKVYGPDFYVDNSGNNTKGNTTWKTTGNVTGKVPERKTALPDWAYYNNTPDEKYLQKNGVKTVEEARGKPVNLPFVVNKTYSYEDQLNALDPYWLKKLGLQ